MDIDFEYLQKLLKEVNELRENFKYSEISVSEYDEITYIANKNDTRIGVQQGLRQALECNRRKLREKNSIRKGTLNFCKLYKKEDKLVRVESYVKGRIDVVFIAYYKEDKRFLFPFSSIGGFYPTYSYVTHFKNEIVDEEYYAERLQIVYERYQYSNDNTVDYPPTTEQLAIPAHLADKNGVTLRIYNLMVDSIEQDKIVQQAMHKNHMMTTVNNVNESIKAQDNINDIVELVSDMNRNKEPLLHCSVFIELKADTEDKLRELQNDARMELTRAKISVDRLILRQKEGFLSALPSGTNIFGTQYERILPASAVANLYPLNYSGKTDEHGSYLGRDKYGSNVLVDFDRRTEDKTNSNILILGNSGQGKSYLMKLLLCNIRESGKNILVLDPELEYRDLCENLGGTYIDMMSGEYMINPLEPKSWTDGEKGNKDEPATFRKVSKLSQHISYLKDFFQSYTKPQDIHNGSWLDD